MLLALSGEKLYSPGTVGKNNGQGDFVMDGLTSVGSERDWQAIAQSRNSGMINFQGDQMITSEELVSLTSEMQPINVFQLLEGLNIPHDIVSFPVTKKFSHVSEGMCSRKGQLYDKTRISADVIRCSLKSPGKSIVHTGTQWLVVWCDYLTSNANDQERTMIIVPIKALA